VYDRIIGVNRIPIGEVPAVDRVLKL